MTGDRPATSQDRARYRRFVKEHHPDVGGDPATFVAGLAAQRSAGTGTDRYDAPVVIGSPRRRMRLVRRLWRRLRGPYARSRVR
jgi:curved DNA-binding protein CbpA